MDIEKKVEELVTPIILNLGFEVYDVIYEKQGQDNVLTIFIDKEGGINIEDCELVNDNITDLLDEKDLIKDQYMLSVSSPGIERLIRKDKHLEANINKKIKVNLYKKLELNKDIGKEFECTLISYDDEFLTIKIDNDQISNNNKKKNKKKDKEENDNLEASIIVMIKKSDVSKMQTVFDWNSIK